MRIGSPLPACSNADHLSPPSSPSPRPFLTGRALLLLLPPVVEDLALPIAAALELVASPEASVVAGAGLQVKAEAEREVALKAQ